MHPTDRVVVPGNGKLGLLCAQVLALTGCNLTAVGDHPEKLNILARQGIVTAHEDELVEARADLVIEATGHPAGYTAARRLIRPRGSIVLKSTYKGSPDAEARYGDQDGRVTLGRLPLRAVHTSAAVAGTGIGEVMSWGGATTWGCPY